ncbi:MAG: PKD domain-containing protein [Chloroflexota bacterium]|nr:PKD domain-containing protein [Chloroflexota bacterium]
MISFSGSGSDIEGESLTYSWNFGDGTAATAFSASANATHTYADNGTYTAKLTVKDASEATSTPAEATVRVANVAPSVGAITANPALVEVNKPVSVSANFTDPGVNDTHTAVWDWGTTNTSTKLSTAAGTVTESKGSGSVSGSVTYTTPGVYTVKLTITDKDGGAAQSIYQYVVVYDPNGGFVTGGGWIMSPKGASTQYPDAEGRANFGFVSKYQKGASVPSGQTQFQFQAGNLNFHSTVYEWLTISGPKAQFKGSGTINGAGDYGFILTANDGQITGGGGVDKFRIKITDKATGKVVYDNQMGETDDSNATTAISGGSIVIHSK